MTQTTNLDINNTNAATRFFVFLIWERLERPSLSFFLGTDLNFELDFNIAKVSGWLIFFVGVPFFFWLRTLLTFSFFLFFLGTVLDFDLGFDIKVSGWVDIFIGVLFFFLIVTNVPSLSFFRDGLELRTELDFDIAKVSGWVDFFSWISFLFLVGNVTNVLSSFFF